MVRLRAEMGGRFYFADNQKIYGYNYGKIFKVIRYVEENGYEITGNIRESYIDGMWNKDTEDEWLTKIQIPVRKIETT